MATPSRVLAQSTTPDSATRVKPPQLLHRVTVSDSLKRTRRVYLVARSKTATRTDALLRDVPQSITTISASVMRDQSMQGMAEVLRYVPGITMAQGEGHRDAPVIRGQSTTADFFIDGIRDDAQYYRDTYNVERVEALKGPNAMVFGRGGGGGVINRVTKGAQWVPTGTLTVSGGNFDQRRTTLDVGRALTPQLAARMNALYEHSATFRQRSGIERVGINPTAAVMLGGTLVRVGYELYSDRRVVDRGIPSFAGRPATAPIATFFGDPDASQSQLQAQSLAATVDRQLWHGTPTISGLQFRNHTRLMSYDKFYQNVFPGAVSGAQTSVSLQGYNNGTDRTNLFNQSDLTTSINHGSLRQTLLVGAELGVQRTVNVRKTGYFGDANSSATSLTVPFDQPTVRAPVAFRFSATDADGRTTLTTRAVYAQNQIEVGPHLQAIVGMRLERLSLDFLNRRSGQRLTRTDVLASPRAGVVLKPVEGVSVYGSLGRSFLPGSGDQFGSLTTTTQTLEPEQFTNREVGVKWDVGTQLALTAAAFRLDRTNTTAPDPQSPSIVVQTGAQRSRGWELGITGSPSAHWQLIGGYSNQVATIVSRTVAAAAGARVPLVPRHTFSLWNRVQPTFRIGLGAGVVHQSEMFAAIDNSVTLPSFTRLDGALFLNLSSRLSAQVNIENLFDRRYFVTAHNNNNIMPGSSRMFRVALSIGQ